MVDNLEKETEFSENTVEKKGSTSAVSIYETQNNVDKNENNAISRGGKIGEIISVCKRINGKRNFILNGLIIVVALIVALTTLFSSVKLSLCLLDNSLSKSNIIDYQNGYFVVTDIDEDADLNNELKYFYTYNKEGKVTDVYVVKTALGVSGQYMHVKKSVFDLLASIPSIFYSVEHNDKQISEAISQFEEVEKAVEDEMYIWALKNSSNIDENEFIIKYTKQKEKIVREKFSEINILQYLSCLGTDMYYDNKLALEKLNEKINETFKNNNIDKELKDTILDGLYTQRTQLEHNKTNIIKYLICARTMIGFGAIIALLSLAIAVVSIVYIIGAIRGIYICKPPRLLRYIFVLFVLVASVAILTVFSPYAKLGGGVIAAITVCSAVLLLYGIIRAYVVGQGATKEITAYVIKNAAFSILVYIMMLVMFSFNAFEWIFENNGVADKTGVSGGGYFLHLIVQSFESGGSVTGFNDGTMFAFSILYSLAAITIIYPIACLGMLLPKLAGLIELPANKTLKQPTFNRAFISGIILYALSIAMCFLSKGLFITGLTDAEKAFPNFNIVSYATAHAQLYIMFVLSVAFLICNKLIKTTNIYLGTPPIKWKK